MAAINKIEKYNLADRVLALSGEGKTTLAIAGILSDELDGTDSISQPTVARFLKAERDARSEQTRHVVHEHIKATVPADLDAIDEVEAWLLQIFRDKRPDPETGELVSAGLGVKDRADIGMKVVRVVETKMRFAGLFDGQGPAGVSDAPVDLEEFRNELDSFKKECDRG